MFINADKHFRYVDMASKNIRYHTIACIYIYMYINLKKSDYIVIILKIH